MKGLKTNFLMIKWSSLVDHVWPFKIQTSLLIWFKPQNTTKLHRLMHKRSEKKTIFFPIKQSHSGKTFKIRTGLTKADWYYNGSS
jgi:hypothetical protein